MAFRGGEIPENAEVKIHKSSMQAPDELPNIDEALETLDQELGFLD